MIEWIRASRLLMKNSLTLSMRLCPSEVGLGTIKCIQNNGGFICSGDRNPAPRALHPEPYTLNPGQGQNLASIASTTQSEPLFVKSHEERKMLYLGTDPESYITEYTLVHPDQNTESQPKPYNLNANFKILNPKS
jgi:hypothetical protein